MTSFLTPPDLIPTGQDTSQVVQHSKAMYALQTTFYRSVTSRIIKSKYFPFALNKLNNDLLQECYFIKTIMKLSKLLCYACKTYCSLQLII